MEPLLLLGAAVAVVYATVAGCTWPLAITATLCLLTLAVVATRRDDRAE